MEEEPMTEEKEELVISRNGGVPYKRRAHFLKPNAAATEGPSLKLPSLSPKCKWPLHLTFFCWRDPPRKWKTWVEKMKFKYQYIWKKVGIYDGIMSSTYKIYKNLELIFAVAERWCPETNTFMFPWGEATITLEDMIVVGGFSVLGGPISLPIQGEELITVEKMLNEEQKDIVSLNTSFYSHWMNWFMRGESPIEHEAFLAMWLSKFVFPGNHIDMINEHVFPIAVHLSRGTRIALAPAVLASIYRDLTLLKESMAVGSKLYAEGGGDGIAMSLWGPLQLVQIWAWERIVKVQPKPNFVGENVPRIARWHAVKQQDTINMRPAINSAGEAFLWRPYVLPVDNWSLPKLYMEKGEWMPIGESSNEDEDIASFARCLRVCELLGIDCRESYQPHRVAMQFGYDQDLPQWIPRTHTSPEMAWYMYSRPFGDDAYLFVPSRLTASDVTYRYMEWWRKQVLVPVDAIRGVLQRPRSAKRSRKSGQPKFQVLVKNEPDVPPGFSAKPNAITEEKTKIQDQVKNEPDVPPGFPAKPNIIAEEKHTSASLQLTINDCLENGLPLNLVKIKTEPDSSPDFPPGFCPKQNGTKENLRTSEITMEACNKHQNTEERLFSDEDTLMDFQFPIQSPSSAAGGQPNASAQVVQKGGSLRSDRTLVNVSRSAEQRSSLVTFQLPGLDDLDARVRKIERLISGMTDLR